MSQSAQKPELGPFALIGARLIERGYSAISVIPQSKVPGILRSGQWIGLRDWSKEYSKRLASLFEINSWSRTEAGVTVVCGKRSCDLIGIDIDTEDKEIVAALEEILPRSMLVKRGMRGSTAFYRCPGLASQSFRINGRGGVDIISDGRHTVLPPSIHERTGEPYQWIGPYALEDTDPQDLIELEQNIGDKIAEVMAYFGWQPPKPKYSENNQVEEDSFHRQLNTLALRNLDAWVPALSLWKLRRTNRGGYEAVAIWRKSTEGRSDDHRDRNLQIHPDGIVDFGDGKKGYSPIDLVMAAAWASLDTSVGWLADRLGLDKNWIIIEETIVNSSVHTAEIIPIRSDMAPNVAPKQVNSLEPLTHVEGLVGEIIDWIVATARNPHRELALGSAISIIGTLAGRRAATPTRSGTHLYVLGLAPTGAGKQHVIDCSMRLMEAAGAKHHIGPSQFMSMTSVIDQLIDMTLSLCLQDEFGGSLKRIANKKASGHEVAIPMILRTAWSYSFGKMVTPRWAQRKQQIISCPALSIYGLSTQREFYGALQSGELESGFLNRFLSISVQEHGQSVKPIASIENIPDSIINQMHEIYRWNDRSGLVLARLNDPTLEPNPEICPWETSSAEELYNDTRASLLNEINAQDADGLEFFLARTMEIAVRLATILAIGRNKTEAKVTLADMQWGIDVAMLCGRFLSAEASLHMADTERQRWSLKIERLIRRRQQVSVRDIQQHLRGAIKASEVRDILNDLCEAGIATPLTEPAGPARRITGYRICV